MSTPALNTISAAPQFASITDLAGMLGVTKGLVSRKAARLEAMGMIETRSEGPGRPKMVNVAAYLAATEQTTDAIRASNSSLASASPDVDPKDPVLAKEQARKVAIQADLAQIELDQARGRLMEIADVREAMTRAAGALVRVLESFPGRAGDVAAAVARDGELGARASLKEMVRDSRERLAAAMTLLTSDVVEEVED